MVLRQVFTGDLGNAINLFYRLSIPQGLLFSASKFTAVTASLPFLRPISTPDTAYQYDGLDSTALRAQRLQIRQFL